MPHLHLVTPDLADSRGAGELYAAMHEVTGRDPTPFWQSQSTRPDLAAPLWSWFRALMLEDSPRRRRPQRPAERNGTLAVTYAWDAS